QTDPHGSLCITRSPARGPSSISTAAPGTQTPAASCANPEIDPLWFTPGGTGCVDGAVGESPLQLERRSTSTAAENDFMNHLHVNDESGRQGKSAEGFGGTSCGAVARVTDVFDDELLRFFCRS